MNNYNGRNRNNDRNNNYQHGGGHTRKSFKKRTVTGNNHGGKDGNFTKFADNDHRNKEREYWPQNDWNYNNSYNTHYSNPSNSHGIANSGGVDGCSSDGIFHWQRKNPFNPLIIPPQVPPNIQTINKPCVNNETKMKNIDGTVSNNVQQPSTPQRKQVENQNDANSTPRSRNNSISAKSNESRSRNNSTSVYTNTNPSSSVDNVETNPALVAKPVSEAVTNFTVKIKQEKQDIVKLKRERNSSSSSSSSEESSSDEEPEPAKNNITKTPVVKPTTITTPAATGNNSSLNIKLKPQQKPAVKVHPTILTPKTNASKKPVSSSSSSSSSSSEDEQSPPPKPVVKEVIKIKAKPVIKQETKVKKSPKKKNSSEDDVVCMGQLENKIILEDDDDDENKSYSESGDEDQLEELSTSKKTTKLKISSKKTIETCMICDKKGHTSFQCQMICKNCSAPYHGFRTCPQPANLSIMLQLFMEFCMQQIQNYNPEKQFTLQTATKSSIGDTVPKPQAGSPSTSKTTKNNNKLKRKQATTKESKTIVKPSKKPKLSNIRKRIPEDNNDEDDSDNSSGNEEDSTDTEDSSSSKESLVSANTKRKSKNAKSENISMNDFNLSNFIPNPVNLPLVLNGFPNLTTAPTNVTNPNTSTNALNTLLLTQMFQNVIGSMKHN